MAPEQKYFDFKTILLLKFYLTGHTEGNCHLRHQEYDRCSSVADKGQRYPCIGYRIGYNGNIKNYLYGNMAHNAHNEQRPE